MLPVRDDCASFLPRQSGTLYVRPSPTRKDAPSTRAPHGREIVR